MYESIMTERDLENIPGKNIPIQNFKILNSN